MRANTAKSRRLFNTTEQVCFFGVKTPPTCEVCITCRRGFSRERGVSNELNREGYLIPLKRFAFSALKRLPRVKCVSLVGRALAVNLIKDVAAQTRHASITPTV